VSSSGITGFHSDAKAEPPGVVTGRYGTIGEVFFLEEPYWPLNTALYVVDFKGNDPRFVSYLLKNLLRDYQTEKAAVPGVDRNVLHFMKVRLPDDSIQKKISSILRNYDHLIEINQRRAVLLEDAARMLFREWFVHFRFPGHEHVAFIDGLPEGWSTESLSDVCEKYDDGDWLETKDQGGSDFRLLQISNIGDNQFRETKNYRFISEETFRRLRCQEIIPGDILISRMPRPIGRGWLVSEMPFRMVTAVDVTIARACEKKVTPYYLLHHINSAPNIARCEAGAIGATRPRIPRKNMGSLPIVVPPLLHQHRFSEFAACNQNLKENLFQQCRKLAEARDLLLPRLLSGEVAV
jgi:type I restriction enzyme S subunit